MDEVWIRAAVIAAVLVLVVGVALLRRRSLHSPRSVRAESLGPGVYFFASATCQTCDRAREKLDHRLGEDGYTEFNWAENTDLFEELEVSAVPSVLVVAEGGAGRLYPGQPERALRAIRRG